MTIPEDVKFEIAPRFYRAAWGVRDGTVVFMNATHMWYLDLQAEVGSAARNPYRLC
jgi:hypothetical protein